MASSRHAAPRRRARPRRRFLRWRALLLVPALVVLLLGVSLAGAALSPGNQSFEAKWADWLRAHHAGLVAQRFEEIYYSATAPPKGGRPQALNQVPGTVGGVPLTTADPAPVAVSTTTVPSTPSTAAPAPAPRAPSTTVPALTTTTTAPPGLPAPSPVPLVVRPALPGEGQWQATGPLVRGVPAMYVAQFRADDVYTSQITTAVWVDPERVRLRLVPGSTEPGGTWAHPPYVTPAELPYLVAAFNGGFRFQDARGGIYLEAKTGVALVAGAASFVIYRDGRVDIGAWGREVSMTPEVASVLQNVVLLVDKGQLTFNFYSHAPGRPAQVTGTKLYPEMQRPADRYLPPVWEARDFFEVLLPGAGPGGP